MSPIRRYRCADVEIDLGSREIRRAGLRVDVEAKVFDLIELLLLARGRALTKTELVSALWPGRPVTDAALSQQLRKARRALGDDGDAQRVIRTVHGRGLVWVAEVAEIEDLVDAPSGAAPDIALAAAPVVHTYATPRVRRWMLAAAAGALLLVIGVLAMRLPIRAAIDPSAPPRIAVLPVADDTGDSDLAWTSAGLMGLMSSLIGQSGGLEVVSAQNVQAAAGSAHAPDATDLGALRSRARRDAFRQRAHCGASVRSTSSICASSPPVRPSDTNVCTAARRRRSRSMRSRACAAGST